MTSNRGTELAPFVLDLIDFMEEKIQGSMADEASRAGAVSEAAGALPLLRDRLREDETRKAPFTLFSTNNFTGRMPRSGGRSSPGWIARHSRSRPPT